MLSNIITNYIATCECLRGYDVIEKNDKDEEMEIEKEGQCLTAKKRWRKVTHRFEVVIEVVFTCS